MKSVIASLVIMAIVLMSVKHFTMQSAVSRTVIRRNEVLEGLVK